MTSTWLPLVLVPGFLGLGGGPSSGFRGVPFDAGDVLRLSGFRSGLLGGLGLTS